MMPQLPFLYSRLEITFVEENTDSASNGKIEMSCTSAVGVKKDATLVAYFIINGKSSTQRLSEIPDGSKPQVFW